VRAEVRERANEREGHVSFSVSVFSRVLQCVAVFSRVLQCALVCCSVL